MEAISIFLSIDYGKCWRFKRYKGDWSPPLCGLQRHLAVMPVGNLMPTDHGGDHSGQHSRLHCTIQPSTVGSIGDAWAARPWPPPPVLSDQQMCVPSSSYKVKKGLNLFKLVNSLVENGIRLILDPRTSSVHLQALSTTNKNNQPNNLQQ